MNYEDKHADVIEKIEESGFTFDTYSDDAPTARIVDVWSADDWRVEVPTARWLVEVAGLEPIPKNDQGGEHGTAPLLFANWLAKNDRDRTVRSARDWMDSLDAPGLYAEGPPIEDDTLNGRETLLDQHMHFVHGYVNGEPIVVVQSISSGYGRPMGSAQVFRICDRYGAPHIFMDTHGSIGCTMCDNGWHTDDAWHFYGNAGEQNLSEYDGLTVQDVEQLQPGGEHWEGDGLGLFQTGEYQDREAASLDDLDAGNAYVGHVNDPVERDIGRLVAIRETDKLMCPTCGHELGAHWR